jgi:hypothetical protein
LERHRIWSSIGINTGATIIVYVNNLPHNIKNNSKLVLFADDTSALITSNNLDELQTKLVCTLIYMREWFTAYGLKLNIHKTNIMHFKLNFSSKSDSSHIMRLIHKKQYIQNSSDWI